ncbi:MAG: sigma 54-interacting transcriptional regulator, partial [Deltaproteobacteria bacterium]|nr:sigma 54-interacting transcriptional regulator [Deltaproteobacteria bacterium]
YAQIWKTGGNYKKAAFFFDEGWSIAQELGKEDLLKKAALSTTDFLFWQGRVAEAVKRYEQVIGNLEEFSSDETTLQACAALGWCYGICGQTARGIGLIEAVRMKAEESSLSEVKIYADLMTSLTLLDARRVSEAEAYLNQILRLPEEILGHYVLWAVNAMMAYVRFHYGDLKTCFKFQNRAHENSKKIGWPHRILNWPDIYMKGVAYRYKAQRYLKNNRPRKQIYKDLGLSSDFLIRAGAKLELSRTQMLMARLLLEDNDPQNAQKLLKDAWDVISNVNEDLFPADLKQYIAEEDQEELLIRTIVEVGNTLGIVRNEKKLLERIINLTMRFTTAERGGFFLLNEKGQLDLVASRNLDLAMVNAEWFKSNYRIIHDVAKSGKGIIDKGSSGPSITSNNVQKSGFKIFSPVILQDRVLGVLYLDSSIIRRHLADKDLPLLTAIGNQVAIALDNVHAYQEIAELKDRLKEETRFYRMELELPPQLDQIVGRSDGIRFVQNQIKQVASTDSTVLISGKTGVGKELVARAIHGLSARSEGPFIPVNIASLSESLIESELFGHEKGAFTGASQVRRGRFELAHNGTLFLDDIENLSSDAQIKLLRILQERVFERVGGTKTIKSDFRLIAATNQDLEEMIKKHIFRSDLYYRINVFPIHIPPLRERKDDIALLASHFLEMYSTKMRKGIKGLSKYNIKRLTDYSWPGNVRELQHVIERAVILTTGESLKLPNLDEVGASETSEK